MSPHWMKTLGWALQAKTTVLQKLKGLPPKVLELKLIDLDSCRHAIAIIILYKLDFKYLQYAVAESPLALLT